MATAKEAQHDAAESIFGAIIAVLDKHEHQHTLTPEILEQLAGAYAAVASNVPEPARLGAERNTEPSIIGDQRGANLDVVQGLRGHATAAVTVDPSAVG
ncbi:MAG: hypothetical protein QOI30_2928 [Mycobacterium sp.]|nr:hypothetical protein [Mycobacterium sp.]